jgi:hypothetical protein
MRHESPAPVNRNEAAAGADRDSAGEGILPKHICHFMAVFMLNTT